MTITSVAADGVGQPGAAIWSTLTDVLAAADTDGVLANKMGPLAARIWRERGRVVPAKIENEERLARAAWMTTIPLLGRIRSEWEGPLLLIKGPEVAALYPGRARAFLDVDLLCPDPEGLHGALQRNGFIEVDDPELFIDQHHLRPLQLPGLWVQIEIHLRPLWPKELASPPAQEIFDAAVPSATGISGISAPDPAHHALVLAGHHWATQPLQTLRDVVDVAAVAARADPQTLTATAQAWGAERIWRTTNNAAAGLFGGSRQSVAVRVWARHLPAARERSVLSNHLGRWLNHLWGLPLPLALRGVGEALRQEILPYPGETWREKLIRVAHAIARPRAPMSSHAESWREAAEGSRDRR